MKQTACLVGLAVALVCMAPTIGHGQCCGDCNGDRTVAVNELVTAVGYALSECPADGPCCGDCDGSGNVAINELITSVGNALNGCPLAPTATIMGPSRTVTATPTVKPTPTATPTAGRFVDNGN